MNVEVKRLLFDLICEEDISDTSRHCRTHSNLTKIEPTLTVYLLYDDTCKFNKTPTQGRYRHQVLAVKILLIFERYCMSYSNFARQICPGND